MVGCDCLAAVADWLVDDDDFPLEEIIAKNAGKQASNSSKTMYNFGVDVFILAEFTDIFARDYT